MEKIKHKALTFDDVLLLPRFTDFLPAEAQLETKVSRNISLKIPLISAAMDTVTEAAMAIALAENGGIGILHKNNSIEEQAAEVRVVKKYESGVVRDPSTIQSTRLQPSISAVSSISFGTLLKKSTMIHTAIGMSNTIYTTISPIKLSKSPNLPNMIKNGIDRTIGGMIR